MIGCNGVLSRALNLDSGGLFQPQLHHHLLDLGQDTKPFRVSVPRSENEGVGQVSLQIAVEL